MSNSQRKKKLAAIKQTEKYLEDQQAKIELQLEQINEPLNTNFNGEWPSEYNWITSCTQWTIQKWWLIFLELSSTIFFKKGDLLKKFEVFIPNWTSDSAKA